MWITLLNIIGFYGVILFTVLFFKSLNDVIKSIRNIEFTITKWFYHSTGLFILSLLIFICIYLTLLNNPLL